MTRGHIVFNGVSGLLKFFFEQDETTELQHMVQCRDVGVADGSLVDPYGHNCKCPPGMYFVGVPEPCAIRLADGKIRKQYPDDQAYGCFFTPITDDPTIGALAAHGRSGLGLHGGGSDLPEPFALEQGWEWTFGCLRLQNADNERILIPFIESVRSKSDDPNHSVTLTVYWGPRSTMLAKA
ncbi:MAG: hypothetical protein NVSMB64_30890 [Candidatus Velthaea sp.]